MSYVYILRSLKNGRFYIGSTDRLEQRLVDHNSGKVSSTKSLRPLEIVFKQKFSSYQNAYQAEKSLKKLKRRDYILKIIEDGVLRRSLTLGRSPD